MPKKIGKIWTPIDTANPDEVKKHPLKARVQEFRNGWLKFRNESLTTKSARIKLQKPETNSVRRCLARLSQDLSRGSKKQAALGEISKLTSSIGRWDSAVEELDFGKRYTANQLQQLRKNSKLLLKGDDLSDNQRKFLTAVFQRVDSDLVMKKGYDHSKLPDPPPPAYVPPDKDGIVETDPNANMPVPEPDLPPAPENPTEEHILDVIDRDMANSAAEKAKAASSQFAEGPPPPPDAPPPPPVAVKERPQTPDAPVEQKPAEVQSGGAPTQKSKRGKGRVHQHVRNQSAQPIPHRQMLVPQRKDSAPQPRPPVKEDPFDLTEFEELLRTGGLPRQPQPRRMDVESVQSLAAQGKPASEANPPISAEPTKEELKPEAPSRATNASQRELHKKMLDDTRDATPLQKRPYAWDDVSDPDATPPLREVELPPMSAPIGEAVPHWLADLEFRNTPKERAHDLAEALLRAMEHKGKGMGDNGAKWIFMFLNMLADPALAEFIPGAITNATNVRLIGENGLRFMSNAMHTLQLRKDEWEEDFTADRVKRLEAILKIWETLVTAAPVLRPTGESPRFMSNTDWKSLETTLHNMDLPAPAPARPAVPRPRPNWPPINQ
jgi:hypothetical protein